MPLDPLLTKKREEILRVAARHGAYNVRVFGSMARGEATAESDIDFLVDMESGRSLLDLGGLLMDLRALFDRDVDVVTENGLRIRIRDRVLREAVRLGETTESVCSTYKRPSNALSGTRSKAKRLLKPKN